MGQKGYYLKLKGRAENVPKREKTGKGGYGVVYQDVTRNKNISAAAKGLYAYLAAYCGASDECYPSVETITKEMGIGKDTFYRHINSLVAAGVVEKQQVIGQDGKFGRTVYRVTHEVVIHDYPFPQNADTVSSYTEDKETINNNSLKNNMDQLIADMYNSTCVSFPKITKLSDKRKKAIRARFNQGYTIEDFKRLFELAEASSFLKGGNSRNWSATFDWLVSDGNMAKVLDGNYSDRGKAKGGVTDGSQSESSVKLW
jgi:uncharacterized phage protein (TIGR02220 family)